MCQQVHKIKGKDTGISWQTNAPLKNVSGSYGEAVIRWKKKNNNNKYIGLRAKAKGLKQSTSGESSYTNKERLGYQVPK